MYEELANVAPSYSTPIPMYSPKHEDSGDPSTPPKTQQYAENDRNEMNGKNGMNESNGMNENTPVNVSNPVTDNSMMKDNPELSNNNGMSNNNVPAPTGSPESETAATSPSNPASVAPNGNTTGQSANAGAKPDIFADLSSLVPQGNDFVPTKVVLTGLEARKPKKDEWVRTHPTIAVPVNIYVPSQGSDTYLVLPAALGSLEKVVKRVNLTLAVNYTGALFAWPVAVPVGDKPYPAHVSSNAAAEQATNCWTRVVWNKSKNDYDVTVRPISGKEPQWSAEIPDASEMLRRCCESRGFEVIGSSDHPVVQQYLGLA